MKKFYLLIFISFSSVLNASENLWEFYVRNFDVCLVKGVIRVPTGNENREFLTVSGRSGDNGKIEYISRYLSIEDVLSESIFIKKLSNDKRQNIQVLVERITANQLTVVTVPDGDGYFLICDNGPVIFPRLMILGKISQEQLETYHECRNHFIKSSIHVSGKIEQKPDSKKD